MGSSQGPSVRQLVARYGGPCFGDSLMPIYDREEAIVPTSRAPDSQPAGSIDGPNPEWTKFLEVKMTYTLEVACGLVEELASIYLEGHQAKAGACLAM